MSTAPNSGKHEIFPLEALDGTTRRAIRGVLTDFDDTLTCDGLLPAAAYGAIERLHQAGFLVVPVPGRPAGWCDMIARFWPVDAVVGENGAFYYRYDSAARRVRRVYAVDRCTRGENRQRLDRLAERIKDRQKKDAPTLEAGGGMRGRRARRVKDGRRSGVVSVFRTSGPDSGRAFGGTGDPSFSSSHATKPVQGTAVRSSRLARPESNRIVFAL